MARKVPISLPPGIVLGRTEYEAQGRYISTEHIRFVQGKPEKIGGWEQWSDDGDEVGTGCRSALCWQDYSYNLWYVFGTSTRLYVFDQHKTRYNITPYVTETSLTDPFTTTNGSDLVTVNHTTHGLLADQIANYAGATPVGGITIDGEYSVVSVTDANNYVIRHSSAATSTAGPGGGTVVTNYEIEPGYVDVMRGGGWGIGSYGESTYGTMRTSATYTQLPRYWSLDRYGQYLLALPSGGTLYKWQLNSANRAAAVTNAPTGLFMFVTTERIVMVLGADGEFMDIAWNDDDTLTDWTPSAANTANLRRLKEGNRLIGGASLSMAANIVWSDTAAYLLPWTGTNAVYADRLLATNCGLVGPAAFTVVDGIAFWVAPFGFYMFSGGGVMKIPRSDEIEIILQSIDPEQRFKIQSFYNPAFREVWWIYPDDTSGETEPSNYVKVNIDDWSWDIGTMERNTFGLLTLTGVITLLGVDRDGTIWEHETGVNADDAGLSWHIESGYFDIDDGNASLNIDGYIPDFQRNVGDKILIFTTRDLPEDASDLDVTTYTITDEMAYVDMRLFGRQAKFRLMQDAVDGDFRMGAQRLEVGGTPIKRQR